MNARPAKRRLVLESLQERMLMVSGLDIPEFDANASPNSPVLDTTQLCYPVIRQDARDVAACSPDTVITPYGQVSVLLEHGDQFVFGSANTGRLVRSDGTEEAFADVEIVRGNDADLVYRLPPAGKTFLGATRTSMREIGDGVIVFVGQTLYGVPDPSDVNGDGRVTPIDLLYVANDFRSHGSRQLVGEGEEISGVDVSGDGWVTPIDMLLVLNALNGQNRSEDLPQCHSGSWAIPPEAPNVLPVSTDEPGPLLPIPVRPLPPPVSPTCIPLEQQTGDVVDGVCATEPEDDFSPPVETLAELSGSADSEPTSGGGLNRNSGCLAPESFWASSVDELMNDLDLSVDYLIGNGNLEA